MAVSLALEKHNSDGFYILNTIIWENSPQLGGQGDSAEHRVMNYYIIPGNTITDFYVRAVNIKSQLNLLQDNTGQNNKLTGKFLMSLHLQKDISIKAALQTYVSHWNKFVKFPNNIIKYDFSITLKDIYDNIKFGGIPTDTQLASVILPGSLPSTISNQISDITSPSINRFQAQHHSYPRRQQRPQHNNNRNFNNNKTFTRNFQGCEICKLDAEDMCTMMRQTLTHTKANCPHVHPNNIQIKNTREAINQHNAKYPPPKARPDIDTKRSTPIRPMLHNKPIAKKISFDIPQDDTEDEGYTTAHEDNDLDIENTDIAVNDTDDASTHSTSDTDYLPDPSFRSLDINHSSAHSYEDYLQYQA